MLIHNITFHVDGELNVQPFMKYIRDVFYPSATAKEYVSNPRFTRLITDIGEGIYGFAFSIEAESVQQLKQWKQEIGTKAKAQLDDFFGNKVMTFSTTMYDMSAHLNETNGGEMDDSVLSDSLIELTAMD